MVFCGMAFLKNHFSIRLSIGTVYHHIRLAMRSAEGYHRKQRLITDQAQIADHTHPVGFIAEIRFMPAWNATAGTYADSTITIVTTMETCIFGYQGIISPGIDKHFLFPIGCI